MVSNDRADSDRGLFPRETLARDLKRGGRDVAREKVDLSLPGCRRAKEELRLGGRPGAELGERQPLAARLARPICDRLEDLLRAFFENASLRTARVVLGERGDLLEEARALRVVKEPGRQRLVAAEEPLGNHARDARAPARYVPRRVRKHAPPPDLRGGGFSRPLHRRSSRAAGARARASRRTRARNGPQPRPPDSPDPAHRCTPLRVKRMGAK